MRSLRLLGLAVIVLGLGAVVSACGGSSSAPSTTEASDTGTGSETQPATAGGTFRLVDPSFYLTGGFDPTSEYAYQPWEIYGGMLLRTLVSYRHVEGVAGTEVLPDLATGLPTVSGDGLTYTFTLRPDVEFGPPVNRVVTSKDIAYAFERIASADLAAQYAFYYDVIDGFSVHDGPPAPISGIETPDDATIVFHLKQPAGDFLARLTLPATAPIPEEVGKCFTKAGQYGQYVISSGPYMLEGSDALDISSCGAMKPIAGADPTARYTFVRNPNYDPATDDPEIRENLLDGLVWTVNSNVQDIYDQIAAGDIDGTTVPPPPKVIERYSRDDSLKQYLKSNPANRTWPLAMNLTQPPFDDVHVRAAVNWLLDKAALQKSAGGPVAYPIASHDLPDFLVQDQLADYAPFATADDAGDLDKAKAEMKLSNYDSNKDGLCDAPECASLILATPTQPPATTVQEGLRQKLGEIGIKPTVRQFDDPYAAFGTPSKNIALYFGIPLSADYPDPFGFYSALQGGAIISGGNFNWSLLGLTPEQAPDLRIDGNVDNVPSLDEDISRCEGLAGDDRLSCFADIDKTMTETIAAWVPIFKDQTVTVIGQAVTEFHFDQAQGYTSFAHIAIDPSKQ